MEEETIITCPFGSECREIRDNKVYQCRLYVKIAGTDKQGNEHDELNCSIAWMPILQLEVAGTNRGQTEAIESFRNSSVAEQQVFNQLIQKRLTNDH